MNLQSFERELETAKDKLSERFGKKADAIVSRLFHRLVEIEPSFTSLIVGMGIWTLRCSCPPEANRGHNYCRHSRMLQIGVEDKPERYCDYEDFDERGLAIILELNDLIMLCIDNRIDVSDVIGNQLNHVPCPH